MLEETVSFLDDLLNNDEWAGVDAATNGLQVENSGDVENVAFAVDASVQTVETAAERDADMLVAHHGFFWGGKDALVGQDYERFRLLVENDIALYASHLPLDAHGGVGNNVLLLDALGANVFDSFADFGVDDVGYVGRLPDTVPLDDFVHKVGEAVDNEPTVLDFGADEVKRVAVLTGAGGGHIAEAAETGADVYITGEPKHRAHHDAREHELNVLFAGHYHTETFGVRELRERVDRSLNVDAFYISLPTEV
ncbi:MAG: Nif3-like dinuclear metal center hexameric protein [Halobacteriales archaeon]|nr:Nif3-like dinuclear metal center hexameric protein [Halobacteriales archaeon]